MGRISQTRRLAAILGVRQLDRAVIYALGPGSTKAQHDPLIVPGKRQS
jgi:hypothetical protein